MIVYPGAKVEIHGGSNVNAQTAMETCGHGYFQQFISSFGHGVVAVVIRENNTVEAVPVEQLRFITPDIYHSDYPDLEKRVHDRVTLPRFKDPANCMYCGGHHATGIACPELPVSCTESGMSHFCGNCNEYYNGIHECKGK